MHDGTEPEPTHVSLYDAVYTAKTRHVRSPKAYPGSEFTFPRQCATAPMAPGLDVRQQVGSEPQHRVPWPKYPLTPGTRHVYTDGSGMIVTEEETSEQRFGAGMYDVFVPHGGANEEHDTPMVWHQGRQTVSNGELFAIRDALALPPREGETCLRLFTDSLVTLQLLWKARYSP